jgi:ankyrin repeat protein
VAARCNSVQVVEFLCREETMIDTAAMRKATSEADEHSALSTLHFLIPRTGNIYQPRDYWTTFDAATKNNHRDLLLYLESEVLHHQDSQVLETRFIEAAQRGHLASLQTWLPRICTVQDKKRVLGQALDHSCASGHAAVAAYLIEYGADVNELVEESPFLRTHGRRLSWGSCNDEEQGHNVWPRTALFACLQGMAQSFDNHSHSGGELGFSRDWRRNSFAKQETVIDLPLRNGSNVGIAVKHGRSPLHYAVSHATLATCQELLDRGAPIVSESSTGNDESLLHRAAGRETDPFPVIQALIEAGAEVNSNNTTEGDSSPILNAALEFFALFAGLFVGSESVHEVLTTGPGAVIRWVLRSRPTLQATAKGFTLLLQMAAADGDEDFVRLLIERNVDLKCEDHYFGSALHAAARFNHLKCAKLLVDAGADVMLVAGRLKCSPLRAAVNRQHIAMVQYLLHAGPDTCAVEVLTEICVNRNNVYLSTLSEACSSGNLELVQLLLARAIRIDTKAAQPHGQHTYLDALSNALHHACSRGLVQVVRLLLEHGADIEAEHNKCASPLMAAARAGHLEVMDILWVAGAVLYDAGRQLNVLKELLSQYEKPEKEVIYFVFARLLNTEDFLQAYKECAAFMRDWQEDPEFLLMVDDLSKSQLLLTHVSALGAQRCVDLVLESGVSLVDTDGNGLQALQSAAEFRRYELLSELLSKGAYMLCMPSDCERLIQAVLDGLMPAKEELYGPCCRLQSQKSLWYTQLSGETPTECVCESDRTAATAVIVQLIQMAGTDIDYSRVEWGILMHSAAYLGMLQFVGSWVDAGVDVNSQGGCFGSALNAAIRGSQTGMVEFLLEQQADVNLPLNQPHTTPLHLACKAQNESLLRMLLQNGAFVDTMIFTEGAALHTACKTKNIAIAKILLEYKADVNISDLTCGTLLHVACEMGDEKMFELLLKHGADVNVNTPGKGATLHMACHSRNETITKRLLEHGANVNVFSESHGTPLHVACYHGDVATIKILLEHGADVKAKYSEDQTPLTRLLSHSGVHSIWRSMDALINSTLSLEFTSDNLNQLVHKSVSAYSRECLTAIKSLLQRNPNAIPTAETIELVIPKASRHLDVLKILLSRAPQFEITVDMLKHATDVEGLQFFLQHSPSIVITSELMDLFTDYSNLPLLKYLMKEARHVTPSASATKAAAKAPPPSSRLAPLDWDFQVLEYGSE